MKQLRFLFMVFLFFDCASMYGQNVLPNITVKNLNGKIVVSWLNEYKKPIQNILIQRSYDSLKNYATIGTVLNPQNTENGYPDVNPPYKKMYYRISIFFEGGTYEIGPAARPIKELMELENLDITAIPEIEVPKIDSPAVKIIDSVSKKNTTKNPKNIKVKNQKDSIIISKENKIPDLKVQPIIDTVKIIIPKKIIETAYPSQTIFIGKQNAVVIHLPEATIKKYHIKFFDENNKMIIELKKITDDYLYLDKSNFFHAGWFHFEIYENGELFEKNKFYISKDKVKITN